MSSKILKYHEFLLESNESATLEQACKVGNLKRVKELLEQGSKATRVALINASMKSHTEIMKLLIEAGADVNAKTTNQGETALMRASSKGQIEAVKLLIDSGADVDAKDKYGDTAFRYAFEFLPLRQGLLEIAKLLLDNGADVNSKNNTTGREDTSLHRLSSISAPSSETLKAVKFLIDNGADVNAQDKYKMTPLMELSRGLNSVDVRLQMIKLLLDSGADMELKNHTGTTAFMLAAREERSRIVEFLLEQGADINAKDEKGDTALMWASRRPLHFARGSAFPEMVKILIEHGADINMKNDAGLTPLVVASKQGHKEIVDLLKQGKLKQKKS